MESVLKKLEELSSLPEDPYAATKLVLRLLVHHIKPVIYSIRCKLQLHEDRSDITEACGVFTLYSDQVHKNLINLMEVFKIETVQGIYLQESRQCIINRLTVCISTLLTIVTYLELPLPADRMETSTDSIFMPTMYLVNWIDLAFEVLGKLSNLISVYHEDRISPDFDANEQWKNDVVDCASELHISIDELLLSCMTLCKYCLSEDQYVVKARSRVVLRETKALLSELLQENVSPKKPRSDALKIPIMPYNINVFTDVLKDVLYALEGATNTALLALVIHCFSRNKCPLAVLKEHLGKDMKGNCACLSNSECVIAENCSYVKEFDLFNERLYQIGNFAVACSSDRNRTLSLRSSLSSLEALDTHLVPALIMSPQSYHSNFLIKIWIREVRNIRDNIYLIIDPSAFADKSRQVMQQQLREVINLKVYDNTDVCAVINTGCLIHDFFQLYNTLEPEALKNRDKLLVLLDNLDRVLKECKTVSNLLCSSYDFVYEINMPKNNKNVTLEQLVKRLKLLYSLVKSIHGLLHPQDNIDHLFDCEHTYNEQKLPMKDYTHTVSRHYETYTNVLKRTNVSRSDISKTHSTTKNIPLKMLTKRFRNKTYPEHTFTEQIELLLDDSEKKNADSKNKTYNKTNRAPVVSQPSPAPRTIFTRSHCVQNYTTDYADCNKAYEKTGVEDPTLSLQISQILNKLNELTMNTTLNLTPAAQDNMNSRQSELFSHKQETASLGYVQVKPDSNKEDSNVSQSTQTDEKAGPFMKYPS